MTSRGRFFEEGYDGTNYRLVLRMDPIMLVPGCMLVAVSVPLLIWIGWIPLLLSVPGIGLVLISLGLLKHRSVVVSPIGFQLSWSLGSLGRTIEVPSDDGELFLKYSRMGTYTVMLRQNRRRWRLHEAANRREAEAWITFLTAVSKGRQAKPPASVEHCFFRSDFG